MRKPDILQIVFTVICSLIGCIFLLGFWLVYLGGKNVQQAWQAGHWSATEGEIVKAEVVTYQEGGKRMFSDEYTRYAADFAYSYQVKGTSYQGHRMEIGESTPKSPSELQRRIDPYRVGQRVTVYYDPNQPDQACLNNKARSSSYLLVTAGLFVVMVAFGLLRAWLREYRSLTGEHHEASPNPAS